MFFGMSNYSESEARSIRLPLKLYRENVTLSLGDIVSGFAFACGYATDSSREKNLAP